MAKCFSGLPLADSTKFPGPPQQVPKRSHELNHLLHLFYRRFENADMPTASLLTNGCSPKGASTKLVLFDAGFTALDKHLAYESGPYAPYDWQSMSTAGVLQQESKLRLVRLLHSCHINQHGHMAC